MRRILGAGLAVLVAAALTGCGSDDKKVQVPEKTIDLPKEGPSAVGGGGGGPKNKGGANTGQSSQ
jgi:hypothetical protein